MKVFVGCLDEITLFMNEKGREYPQLINRDWLTLVSFFFFFLHSLHCTENNEQKSIRGKGNSRKDVL